MAKVYYGSQITDIVGSIGGLTFQSNNSGSIVRLRPSVSKAVTEAQQAKNIIFAEASNAWNALSESQRNLWIAFGAAHQKVDYYGSTKTLSGRNWFMGLYMNALSIGGTPLVSPPTWAVPNPVSSVNYTLFRSSQQSFNIVFNAVNYLSGYTLLLFASALTSETSVSNRSNIFWLHNYVNITSSTLEFYQYWEDYWMAGHEFLVTNELNANIKFGLVVMSNTSFLTSTAVFGIGKCGI